jgi:hypothetical protein
MWGCEPSGFCSRRRMPLLFNVYVAVRVGWFQATFLGGPMDRRPDCLCSCTGRHWAIQDAFCLKRGSVEDGLASNSGCWSSLTTSQWMQRCSTLGCGRLWHQSQFMTVRHLPLEVDGWWCFLITLSAQNPFEGTTALPGSSHVWNTFTPMIFRFHPLVGSLLAMLDVLEIYPKGNHIYDYIFLYPWVVVIFCEYLYHATFIDWKVPELFVKLFTYMVF